MDIPPRLPKEPARDYALRVLKHNILSLHLPPGAMISTTDMAERIGVSRTPVREAMQELENCGLLEIYPQAGSRISYIDYDIIAESTYIRQTLETSIVSLACDTITPDDAERFRRLLDEHAQRIRLQGGADFLEVDREFHKQLYILTGRMLTYQTLERCLWHFDRLRTLSFHTVPVEKFLDEHHGIFAAIAARDKAKARRLTVRHLTRYLKDEKAIRAKYPDYFADRHPRSRLKTPEPPPGL